MTRSSQRPAPRLVALMGVGPEVAGQLLVTAGDNTDRLRSEAAFAHRIVLCRLRYDPTTQADAARRTKQGLSKPGRPRRTAPARSGPCTVTLHWGLPDPLLGRYGS